MINITDKDFSAIWGEALASTDRDVYVSEWSTSSIWGAPEDLTDDDLLDIAAKLGSVWDVAHMSVKDICKAAGLTQTGLAQRFCIPRRTVEDWCRGVRKAADYDRLMMAELLGLLKR